MPSTIARSTFILVASLSIVFPALAGSNPYTQFSPGIGLLPANFSAMGGIVIDMVGANGRRFSAQISPGRLPKGNITDASQNFWAFLTQTGFDSYTLQSLLGGGLQKVNIRVTLQDGDSGSSNPIYAAVFGANAMPYSGSGARLSPFGPLPVAPGNNYLSQPAGMDFDASTDLYIAIPLAGGAYINCGYMGQTTTYQLDSDGNTTRSYTGFPGVLALTDERLQSIPKLGYTPFAVTGWFTVPSNQLGALYSTLATTGSMTVGIWDIDPGEQYYDFTQGVADTITDVPLIPPTIISFVATPSTVVGSGTVTLSWQTGAATGVSIDQGVMINPSQVNGSVQTTISSPTTFTLTATSPQGSTSATATVTVLPPLAIATTALQPALAGSPYSTTLSAVGGTSPYRWSLVSGSLPIGLSLSSAGTLSGAPTTAGAATFVLQADDSTVPTQAAMAAFILTVEPALSISTTLIPNALVSSRYSQTLDATGGTPGYTWSVTSGSLPAGISLSADGAISGTPTNNGSSTFTIKATDSTSPTPQTATRSFSITVGPQLAIQTSTLATGVVSAAYSQGLTAAGGTGPYIWTLDAGSLPDGVTLGSNGSIIGTPTTSGDFVFVARATDSTAPTPQTATRTLSIYVVGQIAIETASLPDATAARPYAQPLNADGGIPPYVWTLASGSLPPGIALLATGALIGAPNVAGTYSFILKVADSSTPVSQSATQSYSLRVHPAFTITTSALSGASTAIAYNFSVNATDGVTPYSFAVIFGSLPPGLSLSASGQISGTPTKPGVYNMLIRATDSTAPTAQTCDQPLSLTVDSMLDITSPSLPEGTQGVPYTHTLTALNGLQPYMWRVTGGELPDGLSLLLSGTIVGVPAKAGTFHVTIQATDSSQPTPAISARSFTLIVQTPLTITNTTVPNGLTGTPYVNIFTTTGGQPQYTYTLADGSLPPGLELGALGIIQGTPTAAGVFTFTVQVSDSSVAPSAVNRVYTIAINQPLKITTLAALPAATLESLYSLQLTATGGMTPYIWSTQSALPNGLHLLATGVLIGVPTQTGTYEIDLRLCDTTKPTPQNDSLTVTLTVNSPLVITPNPFPPILPSVPYSAAAQGSGGVPPYAWSVAAGSLPSGLSLNSDGTLAGVTASSGSYDVELTVSDAATPTNTATQNFLLLVAAPFAITSTSPLETAILGKPYAQSLALAGGKPPYSWSVVGGSLPSGLTLSSTGALSGAPTVAGPANFVVQCRDAANETAIKPLTLLVQPALGIIREPIPAIVSKTVYFHLFQVSDGNPAFHWTIANGSLPAGLILTDSGLLTGTASSPGTYPITIAVTDSSARAPQTATAQVNLSVIQPLIAVMQSFAAHTGANFSQSPTATGGAAPYTWAVASGALPPGLSLKDGTISGMPSKAGQFAIILNVTDATGLTAAGLYYFVVTEQLTIPLPTVPNGTRGLSYAAALSAFGGTQPYAWTISAGSLPPGLSLSSSGVIAGTPSATGSSSFTAVVTDAAGQSASTQYTIQIQAPPAGLSIPPGSAALPAGVVNAAYVGSLTVAGGAPPYTWSLTPGSSLPTGLSINGTAIVGAPTTPGTYTFALTVTDAAGLSATSPYVLAIGSGLTITTDRLPPAISGSAYSAIVTAAGGAPPYTWSGPLPFGLTLSSTGVISGTPTTLQGGASATITVKDSSRPALTTFKTFSITAVEALVITTVKPSQLTVGTSANMTLRAQGGTEPYAWTVVTGLLPPGLKVSAAGMVTGTPMAAGSYLTTLRVSDASTPALSATSQVLFTVVDALTITTTTLPNASTVSAYSAALQARGGTPPYSWSLASGALPTGVTLSGGVITGSPSTEGASAFVLRVSDSGGLSATQSAQLVVVRVLTVSTIYLPNGTVTMPFSYTLQASGGIGPYTWSPLPGWTFPAGISLASNGALSGTPTNTGPQVCAVKVTDSGAPKQSATAVLTLTVNSNMSITTTTVPQATAMLLYRFALTAAGGVQPYEWRVSAGVLPAGLVLTSGGILTGTPATADTQTVTIQVTDAENRMTSGTLRVAVLPAPTLNLALSPAGRTLDPLAQIPVQLTIPTPYPTEVIGRLTISAFNSDATLLQNGQSIPSVPFTIKAGSTTATFADGGVVLQSGTSSEPFTLTASTEAPDHSATQQYSILPLPPRLTSGQFFATTDGFILTLHGFSTTREVQSATFRFHSDTSSSAPHTISVANLFEGWYQSAASGGSGLFLYRQPFTMAGAGSITSVEVTLTNSAGASAILTLKAEAQD